MCAILWILSAFQDDEDRLDHSVYVLQDVVIPEAHDSAAPAAEIGGPRPIGFGTVLSAVRLDDQLALQADEVRDERPETMPGSELPAEAR